MEDNKSLDCPQCHSGGSKATWPFCSEYCENRYYENAPRELIHQLHKEIGYIIESAYADEILGNQEQFKRVLEENNGSNNKSD